MTDSTQSIPVKPWWQSKTMWGAVIAGLAPVIGTAFHVSLSDAQVQQYSDAAATVATVLGAILAGYGRTQASVPITQSSALATIQQTAQIVEAAQAKAQAVNSAAAAPKS